MNYITATRPTRPSTYVCSIVRTLELGATISPSHVIGNGQMSATVFHTERWAGAVGLNLDLRAFAIERDRHEGNAAPGAILTGVETLSPHGMGNACLCFIINPAHTTGIQTMRDIAG